MENTLRHSRRRSGYEPSDTETDWPDSPRHKLQSPKPNGENELPDFRGNISPLSRRVIRGNSDCQFSRSERRSNYENNRENEGPFSKSERRRRHPSQYKTGGDGKGLDFWQQREKSSFNRRATSAPRSRLRDQGELQKKDQRTLSPLPEGNRGTPRRHGGEINGLNGLDSIDSISPGDIFFSREYNNAFQNIVFTKNTNAPPKEFLPKPPGYVDRNGVGLHHKTGATLKTSSSNSTFTVSRQSSTVSESSGRTTASTRKFIENRRRSQTQTDSAWFSCIKKGSCRTSKKSPDKERPAFDEASFIGKAVVVESLRPLWADKHQPVSLIGFTCHRQEAQLLQKLATNDIFPHILLKGPPGSGKKALTMALLREIFGDPVWNISHELQYFHILEQEPRPVQVAVPITSSPHHVELNVYLEPKALYALTALVKQIISGFAVTPEISVAPHKADYKVIVLYDVDKAKENIQHLIKWIMDCYSDTCRLVLCCEEDVGILESVTSRCKVINVEAPTTHEVMEVLTQIAKKEGFELSTGFSAKIAAKSKLNLRKAIMALEACKAHKYPFMEDQPIPVGWEEAIVELAADILANPMPKRLFVIRGKIQKLVADFVHPKLILLKLVEQFLKGVEASLKRELYYWYAYYDKRLPAGTSALLKLEEFVAKFMSIYRKNSYTGQQF